MNDSGEKIIWSQDPDEISAKVEFDALPTLLYEQLAPGVTRSRNWSELQQALDRYISRHGLKEFLRRADPEGYQD